MIISNDQNADSDDYHDDSDNAAADDDDVCHDDDMMEVIWMMILMMMMITPDLYKVFILLTNKWLISLSHYYFLPLIKGK